MNKLTTHLQHPNVQATDCLLRLLQLPVHSFTVEQQLEEHPDWPSLLCISDALHQWHIPHLAAKAADQQLPDTHYPLLAVTNHPERPLAVVVGVHNDVVHFYQYSYRQQHQEPLKDFLQRWTGIYLIAEATPQSGDPEYAAAARKRRWQLALPITALLLALTALGGLCWPRLQHLTGSANLSGGGATIAAIIAIFILYLAGLAVSLMLLWYDIDKRNPLLQKVCTGLVKTNCNAILNSSASKLFGWLSWSEIGFAYYAGGLLLMAFPTQAPWALQWLGLVGVAALVYPIFSIYYQWRIAKQWCMLCLAVQAVLVLQGTALWMGNYLPALSLDTLTTFLIPQSAFIIATVYILPLLAWLFLKPWLLRHQTALREQRAYRRLKFNPEVFTSLLHKQKAIATPTNGLGIVLGPANAPHKLLKVCNPYCGPCSKAHPKIEQLLHRHPNLQVQILFMVPNVPGEKYHTAASHLMAISHTATGQAQVQQALHDWYLPETKDYEAFATKYPLNGAIAAAAPTITTMEQWSKANDIRYTPTLFYNGYELPPEYDVEDLSYFLQE